MNSAPAPKPFSTFELAAGSAALAVIASIAFVGLRVTRPQTPSPAAPSSFSTGSISSKKVDVTRTPQSVDRGLVDDNSILPEPSGTTAPGSPAVDGWWRPDDMGRVEQRLIQAGSLWGFAGDIGGTVSHYAGDPAASRTELSTQDQTAQVVAPPSPLVKQNPLKRRINPENTFIGGWANEIASCRQDHSALLIIDAHSARTATGQCDFQSVSRETVSSWRIVAACSSEGRSWSAHIDLKLAGSNLTWSSERGTATYVRCLEPAKSLAPMR